MIIYSTHWNKAQVSNKIVDSEYSTLDNQYKEKYICYISKAFKSIPCNSVCMQGYLINSTCIWKYKVNCVYIRIQNIYVGVSLTYNYYYELCDDTMSPIVAKIVLYFADVFNLSTKYIY